jgi:CRISPR/Cas system-associated exonuclease Cas4 (RecB family)
MPSYGVTCCQDGRPCDVAACKERAARGECQYPLPIFNYIENQKTNRKDAGLSVTTLLGCARRAELQRDHKYPAQPHNMGAVFQGDMWHLAMETWVDYPGAIKETRFAVDIDGVRVTGKADLIIPVHHNIFDHKTTSRPIYCDEGDGYCEQRKIKAPPEGYGMQLSFYRLMAEDGVELATGKNLGITIDRGFLCYNNPTNGARTFEVPLLPKDYVYEYMKELVQPIKEARAREELPPVLEPQLIKRRVSGRISVKRDFRCTNCELRDICDRRAMMDTGMDPNRPEYWEAE